MSELPAKVKSLVDALRSTGFRAEHKRQQVMIWRPGGDKVGGWNTRQKHWYVSKLLAQDCEELLESLGFQWMEKGRHCWWQIDGDDSARAFQNAVEALTGITIPANKMS